MLILKIRALLSDERKINITTLDTILKQVNNEAEFDEAIKPYLTSSPEKFNQIWADYGVAETYTSTWDYLLNSHYNSYFMNEIQKRSGLSRANLESNYTATSRIARDVVNDLTTMNLGFGAGRILSITQAIKDSVYRAFQNNKVKYISELKVNQNSPDTNLSYAKPLSEDVESLDSRLSRLASVSKAEVKAILFDIHQCSHIYKFNSGPNKKNAYSMYESFLRVHFKMQVAEFNRKFTGHFSIVPETHEAVKYNKLDEVMEGLYSDFIIPGISKDNVNELQHAVFLLAKKIDVTHANKIFGQNQASNSLAHGGNFHTGFVFASSDKATTRFDQFTRGLIAVSKLYRYLKDAGFSPNVVNPVIFQFNYEDPSEKFISLKDLVLYSDDYVCVREKYELTDRRSSFKALQGSDASGFVLNLDTDSIIIANRNQIQIKSLSSSIMNLMRNDMSYISMYLPDSGSNINLFSLVNCLDKGLNPLYEVFRGDDMEWESLGLDLDEIIDMEVLEDYFGEVIKTSSLNYLEPQMTKEYLMSMVEQSDSSFSQLVEDVTKGDYESKSKIILAVQSFVMDFSVLLESFAEKYSGITNISEMEYSTFLFKHQLLQPLNQIVDASKAPMNDPHVVVKAMYLLLVKYYPEVTIEKLHSFLDEEVSNTSYGNFLNWIKVRSFSELITYFHYAKANLFNLSDQGMPIMLGESDLQRAIQNAKPVLEKKEFDIRFKDIPLNKLGYLMNSMGELFQIYSYNNKIGALHTNGYYVFNDGDTLPWSGDL